MSFVLFRLAFAFMLICTISLAVLRTRAVDETSLKTLLLPPTCATSCFMGIQPGVTVLHEARDRLESHPWVMEVELVFRTSDALLETRSGVLRWRWNGRQPAALRTPFLDAGEVEITDGVVHSIKVVTSIPFGETWLLLGAPPRGFIGPSRTYLERFYNHQAVYVDHGLRMRTLLPNPLHMDAFWNTAVEITFEAELNERDHYRLPCWWGCS